MKKIITIAALIIFVLGSTIVAYSYWDKLQQASTGELEIGYGVRLEVPTQIKDVRQLVPAGSFYAAYAEDYTTAYSFQYTLTLEDPLQAGMEADLLVDISDFQINAIAAYFNVPASALTINVATDEVAATASATGAWAFSNAFYTNKNTVVVTVTVTLADNGNVNFGTTEYNLLSGAIADFNIGFELVNSASSVAPIQPLQ
jgi:hypothetical protein